MTTLAGEPAPASGPEGQMAAVAEIFLAALAVQDFPRVASVFRADVHLRALLPGGLLEADGPAEVEANGAVDTQALTFGTPNSVLPERNRNAAFYFPYIEVIDPAKKLQQLTIGVYLLH